MSQKKNNILKICMDERLTEEMFILCKFCPLVPVGGEEILSHPLLLPHLHCILCTVHTKAFINFINTIHRQPC